MKKVFFIMMTFISLSSIAQSIDSLGLKLIGPGGGMATSEDGKYTFSYSMGELFTTTARNYNQVLTQGFQQAKMIRVVGLEYTENLNWKVEVYPNPVSEFLNVMFDKVANTTFEVQIYSQTGQLVNLPMENQGSDVQNKFMLDFRTIAAGNYVVKVWNTQSEKYAGTMSVVKSESVK
jgi:hypothetical protein